MENRSTLPTFCCIIHKNSPSPYHNNMNTAVSQTLKSYKRSLFVPPLLPNLMQITLQRAETSFPTVVLLLWGRHGRCLTHAGRRSLVQGNISLNVTSDQTTISSVDEQVFFKHGTKIAARIF